MSPEDIPEKGAVVFCGYFGFLHQLNWLPLYNRYIVESGIKHHQTNQQTNIPENFGESLHCKKFENTGELLGSLIERTFFPFWFK